MPRFYDPNAPSGRVAFGGEAFVDGRTADIDPGPETRALFAAAGIVEEHPEPVEPSTPRLSPKEALQAEAAELGLDTEGTKAEIQARIDEHRASLDADITEE